MNFKGKNLNEIVDHKKILFVTTKNIDYIRNTQEIRMLWESAASVDVVGSSEKSYFSRILTVWTKVTKKKVAQYDLVFIGFAPQLVLPFLKRRFKEKPVVIDFFISVYDTLICDRKIFSKSGIVAKICHKLDEVTIKNADFVVADTKAHANFFVTEFGGDKELFETVYLEADPEIYYPREAVKPDELKDKYVVLYFGSILPLQGVDIVLDAVRKLEKEKDIYFEIIGPVSEKFHKPISDNVIYYDWLSQETLAEHIAYADLCLAGHFNVNIDKAKRTIPGKAYIYEMMGKDMVLGENPANHELHKEDNSHFFVEMGNSDKLAELIAEKKNEGKNRV